MDHQPHSSPESALPKIIGAVVALGLVGAVLYAVYGASRTDATTDAVNAYQYCRNGILSHLARPDTAVFLNQPGNTDVKPLLNGFELLMKVRASNGYGGKLTVTYRCTLAKVNGDFFKAPNLEEVSRQ